MNNRDYIGNTVNNWTILDFEQDKHGGKWLCRCTCGEEKWQKVYNVKNGKSKMCRKCSSKKRNKSESKNKKEKILKIRFDNHKEWTEENTFVGTYKEYLEECKKRREIRRKIIEQRKIEINKNKKTKKENDTTIDKGKKI